jgi:hypothetical protein
MRLGQLARKLALRQSDIIDFLAQRNIRIDESSNTRLEDELVILIMKHYAPTREEEVREELAIETTEPEPTAEKEDISEIAPVENSVENEGASLPDVIRVPKIELSGLKVVGKIELPEPKKKEPESTSPEPTSETDTEKKNTVDRKAVHHKRPKREHRQGSNPIAQQREREAREAAEKRRIEAEREKEKRKQHYHNKVKRIRPPKSVKPARMEQPPQPRVIEKQPTTLLGRFWRWLRYDH